MKPGDWVRVTKPLYVPEVADVMPSDRLIYLASVPEHRSGPIHDHVEGYWDTENYPLTWVPPTSVLVSYRWTREGYHLVMRPGRTRWRASHGSGTVLNPVFKIPLGMLRSVEKSC